MNMSECANRYMYEDEDVEVTMDNAEETSTEVSATHTDTSALSGDAEEEMTPEEEFMSSPEAIQKSYGELLKSMNEALVKSTEGSKMIDKVLLESYSYDPIKVKRVITDADKMYDQLYNVNYALSEVLVMLNQKLNGDDYAN